MHFVFAPLADCAHHILVHLGIDIAISSFSEPKQNELFYAWAGLALLPTQPIFAMLHLAHLELV